MMTNTSKVAVLMGGHSAERDVSIRSGKAVLSALQKRGIEAFAFDPKTDSYSDLVPHAATHAFIALHGRGGEDGEAQAILTHLNLSFTGSNAASSALAMDKWRSKLIWKALGLPVAPSFLITNDMAVDDSILRKIIAKLGPTTFVKPVHEGSSVGMAKANSPERLAAAIIEAQKYDSEILVEAFIPGTEYTVAILDDVALPSISMSTPRDFYDYEAKYHSNDTIYQCPSDLSETEEIKIGKLAIKAFQSLGCSGWGRVDFIHDTATKEFKILEVNTVPGMTETSLVPKAAKQFGIEFDELVIRILEGCNE